LVASGRKLLPHSLDMWP